MPVWTEIDQSSSELVRLLYDWWLGKKGASDVPDRTAVNPIELKKLLPHIVIAEVERSPFRVKYRLVGTRVVEVRGFDFQGRYLDELLSPGPGEPWIDRFRAAFLGRCPLFGASTVATSTGDMFTYEFGIFPLRRGGGAIEQFIAIEDYFGFQSTLQQPDSSRSNS